MAVLRRIVAALVIGLVLMESAGIARALSTCGTIECCCGPHSLARACSCHDCPVLHPRRHPPHEHHVQAPRECDSDGNDADVLLVIATMTVLPALGPRGPIAAVAWAHSSSPRSRLYFADRPPP